MPTDSMIEASVLDSLVKVVGLLGVLSASYLWYRLVPHPLQKFPGPLAAKFTSAYSANFIWRRDFHLKAIEWHAKYGKSGIDFRRVLNNVKMGSLTVQDIYNTSNVTKGKAYVQLRQDTNGAGNLLNTLEREPHRQKRRIVAPVVSERSMRIFEPQMLREIESFLVQILRSSREKETVNMSHRCEWLGVDVVGELAFGYSLNTQSDPLHRSIVDGIKARGDTGSLYFFWKRLRNFDWIFNKLSRSGRTEGLYRSLKMIIEARMKIPKDAKHDFFSMASGEINSKDPGIIGKDFWAEALLFIAAGGTTTATAMSGAFFYLSRNPVAYQRLAAEIRTTFPSGRDIRQGPRLSQCKYLRAVIEETMRMSPSALAIAWREQYPESVAAGESFVVDGHVIPPGTQVGVSNYCLQHDPSIFKKSFAFRPERWLLPEYDDAEATDQSEAYAAMRYAFAPFSLGDRGCAGNPMAYLEMSLVIAKVKWYFDFERAPGTAGDLGGGTKGRKDGRGRTSEFQLYEGVIVGHDGPNLMFTPRDDHCKEIQAK